MMYPKYLPAHLWATLVTTEEEEGHGDGEGIPPNEPPGCETWTVYDWDRYDLLTLLHEHIMVHYSLISYTRIAERVVRNREAHDTVIRLLCGNLDKLIALRDDVQEGQLF